MPKSVHSYTRLLTLSYEQACCWLPTALSAHHNTHKPPVRPSTRSCNPNGLLETICSSPAAPTHLAWCRERTPVVRHSEREAFGMLVALPQVAVKGITLPPPIASHSL